MEGDRLKKRVCGYGGRRSPKGSSCPHPTAQLFRFAGQCWCALHLPLQDEKGVLSPKAHWPKGSGDGVLGKLIDELVEKGHTNQLEVDLSFAIVTCSIHARNKTLRLRCEGAQFHERVRLSDLVLEESTFLRATFQKTVNFHAIKFHFAEFNECEFVKFVSFDQSEFLGGLNLQDAKLRESASFVDAVFKGPILVDRTIFASSANFGASANKDSANGLSFVGARNTAFHQVSFRNRRFLQGATFAGATFDLAPDFHGASLHQATTFSSAMSFKDLDSSAAAERYRTLAQAMADIRAHDEEGWFFALQQRALRKQRPALHPVRVFSAFYDFASNYGQSLGRPLAILATANLAAFGLYWRMASGNRASGWDSAAAATRFTFQQLFRPLYIWGSTGEPQWPLSAFGSPGGAFTVATLQSLVSITAIYLLALGIRWRFRRW